MKMIMTAKMMMMMLLLMMMMVMMMRGLGGWGDVRSLMTKPFPPEGAGTAAGY